MRKHALLLLGLIFAFGIVWMPLTANAQQAMKSNPVTSTISGPGEVTTPAASLTRWRQVCSLQASISPPA